MRYINFAPLLICASAACSDRATLVEPVGVVAPTGPTVHGRVEVLDESFTTDVCGFPLLVELSGKTKTISLPGDRFVDIFPGSTATLTNPANGQRETISNTGTFHVAFLPNGHVELVMTGRNTVEDVDLGLLLVVGTFSYVYDGLGGIVQPLQGNGRVVDLCELLS